MLGALSTIGLFSLLVVIAGPALVPRSFGGSLLRMTVGMAGALIVAYLVGFGSYALGAPVWVNYLLFPAAALLAWKRREQWRALWTDTDVKDCLWAFGAVMCWLIGWLSCIYSFSGATWTGDHQEHFQRAELFTHRLPADTEFLAGYSLSARPPLANVVVSVFPHAPAHTFISFQLVMALMGALAVWPVWLLQRHFLTTSGAFKPAWGALLLMALPTFVQHATYPWTKLPTAFFVLLAIALLVRRDRSPAHYLTAWVALSAGMLTHYSAGPWIVALALVGIISWLRRRPPFDWRLQLRAAAAAGLLFSTWLGWSVTQLGWRDTFGSNTTVSGVEDITWQKRAENFRLNVWTTTVPMELRSVELGQFEAANPVAQTRDIFFQLYHSNWIALCGSVGLILAIWVWARSPVPRGPPPATWFWVTLIATAALVGVAVHAELVAVGLAHISLLPFPLISVAWLAARVPEHPSIRRVLIIGVGIDVALGIAFHFAIQSFVPLRWMYPGYSEFGIVNHLGLSSLLNWQGQQNLPFPLLGELPLSLGWAILLLVVSVGLLVRVFRSTPTHVS